MQDLGFERSEEINLYPMRTADDGEGFTLWQRGDGPIEFFDVLHTRHNEDGSIDILAEFEELPEDEANQIFDRLCAKHPDIDHCVNY